MIFSITNGVQLLNIIFLKIKIKEYEILKDEINNLKKDTEKFKSK